MRKDDHKVSVYLNEEEYKIVSCLSEKRDVSRGVCMHDVFFKYYNIKLEDIYIEELRKEINDNRKLLRKIISLVKLHIACEKFLSYIDPETSEILDKFDSMYKGGKMID